MDKWMDGEMSEREETGAGGGGRNVLTGPGILSL